MKDWAKEHVLDGKAGTLLLLYIQPGASKTAVKGEFASTPPRLKISVAAPPVDGAANLLVVKFIAETLGVAKSQVHFISGEASRQKTVWVSGVDPLSAVICLLPE